MKITFIFFLVFHKIISEDIICHERCEICTSTYTTDSQQCDTCKENTFLLEGTRNCYYDYELPHFYLDEIFKMCQNNCYECTDNSDICISCNRGSQFNEETRHCEPCNTDEYIYVSDGIEDCYLPFKNFYTCELKYTKCSGETIRDNFECPREYPLLNDSSTPKECVLENYNNDLIISNQIIKTQWFNKKYQIGTYNCRFIGLTYSSKGDLIFETNVFSFQVMLNERYFVGVNSNGRKLFYDNNFIDEKVITSVTSTFRFESRIIKINLVNEEKDYYLSCSYSNNVIEIADLENNKINGINMKDMFEYEIWNTFIYSILELKNENKAYLFCFIVSHNDNNYLSLQKFKFYKQDISQEKSYEKIVFTKPTDTYKIRPSTMLSCIEISSLNIIQCFYVNINNLYTISLFDENTLNLVITEPIEEIPVTGEININWDCFFKCIFLKNEISIMVYMLDSSTEFFYLQTKEIIYKYSKYKIENYFLQNKKIVINPNNKYKYDKYYPLIALERINEKKFFLITSSPFVYQLYIIIFEIYNFHDTNMNIRYYHIPFKMYNMKGFLFLENFVFNRFLGLLYTLEDIWAIEQEKVTQYYSLLSYINSIDSDLITLESNTRITLNNYINTDLIENNLFGVILYGIKILKLPKNIGVYYFSQKKNFIISENEILDSDDLIHFVYDYNKLVKDGTVYTIEMTGVVDEPSFTEFKKYPIDIENYGSEMLESHYIKRCFFGKTSFYNFTIPTELTGTVVSSCMSNCQICYNSVCIKCSSNYYLIEDPNRCQTNKPTEGYYFDESTQAYRKCHVFCKTCSNGPIYYSDRIDIEDTNCDNCKDNYYKMINTNNCVYKDNIPISYYLDTSKMLFVNCYENCKTCSKSKTNSTYVNCLTCDDNSIFYEKSQNCLNCVLKDKYVNYYQYDCTEIIPDGYYALGNRVLEKCYISCKSCNEKGDSNNHKCLECHDAYPYMYNNGQKCLDDCSTENLYLESEYNICYSDCSKNTLNDKKYNYKNKCVSKDEVVKNYVLDESNNFVSMCNAQTEFEFNNECYSSCPDGTKKDESNTDQNLCICNNLYYLNEEEEQICITSNVCPNEYPYLKINGLECHNCPVKYKGKCLLKCPEGTCLTQVNANLATCVDKLDETKILGGLCFDDFLRMLDGIDSAGSSNIVMNEYLGITINIYMSDIELETVKEKNPNLTFIDLGECENKLREHYNLNSSQKFCVISVDMFTKLSDKPTFDFAFELYLNNGTQIEDLSPCYDTPISISSAINNLDLVNFNSAVIFYDQGYDIYNLSSEFYNDKCTPANINGNDIIIEDRKTDVYPYNVSFCPNGCAISNAEIESKRFNCSCNISFTTEEFPPSEKEELSLNVQTNENYFIYLLDMLNYKVFGCPNILYNSKIGDIFVNIGFYLGIIIILFNFVNSLIFFLHFLIKIRIQMFNLMPTDFKLYNKEKEFINKFKKSNKENHSTSNPSNKKKNIKNKNKKKNKNKTKKNNYSTKEIGSDTILDGTNNTKKKVSRKNIKKNEPNNINESSNELGKYVNTILELKNISNDDETESHEFNSIPYSQALRIDKRNIFKIYLSIIKMKIDIISIIFYPEEFTNRALLLSIYSLDFLFSYFMNALLYSDDVVSQKYHNNGDLDFITSLSLSLISNVISSILIWIIKKLTDYHEFLNLIVKDVQNERKYIYLFNEVYKRIKIKVFLFYCLSFIINIVITYYLFIFCKIYEKSQVSLLKNYFLGIAESLLKSFGISLIVSIMRFIGLKCKLKYFYRTSIYINDIL